MLTRHVISTQTVSLGKRLESFAVTATLTDDQNLCYYLSHWRRQHVKLQVFCL